MERRRLFSLVVPLILATVWFGPAASFWCVPAASFWCVPAASFWCVPAASAQDDWGLTREPRRPAGSERRPRDRSRRPRPARERSDAAPVSTSDRSALMIDRYVRVLESDPSDGFALDRLIELHRERDGNDDALRASLEARVAGDGDAFAPRMLLGHLARRGHRLDAARAHYEAAAALRPTEALPRASLARVLRESGELDVAATRFEEAIERSRAGAPRDELVRELATLALERGDVDAARRHFDRLASAAGGSVYLRTELARALAARGDHEAAIAEYQRVASTLRGDRRAVAPLLVELARAQLEAGRDRDAVATLERAMAAAGGAAGLRAEAGDLMIEAYRREDRLAELAERLGRGGGADGAVLLARVHDELGHDDEALAAYRRALRSRPRDLDLRLRVVRVLARAGRLSELASEYRTLIRHAPGEPRYVTELAELLLQMGSRDEALQTLEGASRRSREPALHQRLAELYVRWGEAERAEHELELLTRLDPQDELHFVALGSQRFEAGDRAGALAVWRHVLTLGGDRGAAYATYGGILADHDLLSDAIDAYLEAERLSPDAIEIVRALATTLERGGRGDDAEARWRRVLALAGDDRAARREARERIVGIWTRGRSLDAHARALDRAFRADPPDLEAGHMLAEVHRRRRDLERAGSVLARIAELEPGDVDTLGALERVRSQAGDRAGSIEVLRRLVDADPRRAGAYLQRMAEHALALYRDEEALGYAREAVERSPEDATAHRRLGDLQRARQDVDRAIASYRSALERDDRLFETAFDLAEMHLARGEHELADRVYRDVLARAPDDDLVARAARASVQIHVGDGTVEVLERELLPLALAHPERPIFRRVVVEVYDALAGPLLVRARRSGAEGEAAQVALQRWGGRAIKPLLEALADSDPAQRRIALAILGPLGNSAAAVPLLLVAETGEELETRVLALLAAAAVAPVELAPRFAALSRAREPRLRAAATAALGRLGGRTSIDAMRACLDDGDVSVRAWAALGLGLAEDRASAPRIRALLAQPVPALQGAAALALGWLGDREALPALIALARAPGSAAAPAAITALASSDEARARVAIAAALFQPEPRSRHAAAGALRERSRRPERLAMPRAGVGVAEYLASLAEPSDPLPPADLTDLYPALLAAAREALSTPDRGGARGSARAALSVLAGDPAPLGLGELTRDLAAWPEAAQNAAVSALGELAVALLPELSTAARLEDATVRAEAIRVLARIEGAEPASVIAVALDDDAAIVRRAALDALAIDDRGASPEAVARAASILESSDDWGMRTRAARALGRAGGDGASAALVRALADDGFAFVREAAADALGLIGAEEGESALVRACAEDPEPQVRAAAARALERGGGGCEPGLR